MALSGTFLKQTYTTSETETETVTYTRPAETNPASSELLTVTEEVPLVTITEEPIENTYLIITGTSVDKYPNGYLLSYAYRVFASREDNSTIHPSIDEYLFSENNSMDWVDSLPTNPIESSYEHLKSLPECASMVNA